ncbi:TPA: DUF1270 family protein, partial [Staphylococcus aureus]|nr:DUF1270 family protein [Staphylococcus aureus]HDP4417541.1 DUF1270 family protein [Staphylococcus aureus]
MSTIYKSYLVAVLC